jgi:hypothetical protein
MMKWALVLLIMTTSVLLVFGCAMEKEHAGQGDPVEQEDSIVETNSENFQLSITSNPVVDRDIDEVFVEFDKIEVSPNESDSGWVTVSEKADAVDLLSLNEDTQQTLVLDRLEPGAYNQVRLHVRRTWVVTDDREQEVKLPSDTIKLVRDFKIDEGNLTNLVVDFDINRSLRRRGFGRFVRYILIPVIRIVLEDETGGIAGRVFEPRSEPVSISAFRDGEEEAYASTVAGRFFGFYFLPYLEKGLYDIVVEADGYLPHQFEDVKVDRGEITMLDWIGLDPGSAGASITVKVVNTTGESLDGDTIHVTSFAGDGDLPEDRIEVVDGVIENGEATVVLGAGDSGSGYDSGTYGIRAHIDKSNDGLTAVGGADFITVDQVTVIGSDVSLTMDGPWGGYSSFAVFNFGAPPMNVTGSENLYLIVVSQGDFWGNYAYAEQSTLVTSGVISMDLWGPFGLYDFHAMIDMNGNFDSTGVPDAEDYTFSITGIDWQGGFFPDQSIATWE